MVEPFTLLGLVTASAFSGIVGNRADSLVTASYKKLVENLKKGNNPDNHDLQKAIQRSYLQALLKICGECLEKLKVNKKENRPAIKWLEGNTKTLKKQLDDVEKQEFYDVPVAQLDEIELLVTPEGTLAEDRISKVRSKLVGMALEGSKIPNCFINKVKDGLFQEVCGYFAFELKDNHKVNIIFNSQLLAKISEDSEGIKISLEQIITSLQEIAKKVVVLKKPIYTIEEYHNLSYIKPLLDYTKFIGRKGDLKKLHDFLETNSKIMLMSGEGGVGKTKLSLEFAKQVKDNSEWCVYFVNPDIIEVDISQDEEKILFILDDAADSSKRDNLIASVSDFSHEVVNVKLLLISRPIYNEAIESFIIQKNIFADFLLIEKGDIIGFLKEYCDWIDEKTAKKIEKNCLNSFDFARFFAEYYREKGEIGGAYKVINWKVKQYIKDIARTCSLNVEETHEVISVMSLITPIYWSDIEHIKKLPILINKESFEKVLRVAFDDKTSILFSEDGDKFVINPDPLADILRLEFLNSNKFEKIWRHLFPYMASRISINTFVLQGYDLKNEKKAAEILSQMWEELNNICGKNPEYFAAITFFTGNLSKTKLFDINKININHWLRCYKNISKNFPEETIKENLVKSLVNATSHSGSTDKWGEMEACIEQLKVLNKDNPDEKELGGRLAMGIFNAANCYGHADKLENMEACIEQLKVLNEDHPDEKEIREGLANGLVNASSDYGRADKWEQMEACIKQLKVLSKDNPDEKEVKVKIAMGLANATNYYRRADKWNEVQEALKELRGMNEKNPEDENIMEQLAIGLFYGMNFSNNQFYENLLLLYKLRFNLPYIEQRENMIIQIEKTHIKEIQNAIKSEYNKNNGSVIDFVENLQSILKDDTELVILIGSVAVNLSGMIQNSLYEALDELGL